MGLDPRIKMINYCGIRNGESLLRVSNSYGLDLSWRSNSAGASLTALVEDENGKVKNGHDYWNDRHFATLDYEKIGKVAVVEALSHLGATSIESGAYPIVFNDKMAVSLFGTFSGIFFAERAQKGFSMLGKDKVGEAIAGANITLRDDNSYPNSLGGVPFDSEGVATKKKSPDQKRCTGVHALQHQGRRQGWGQKHRQWFWLWRDRYGADAFLPATGGCVLR
jgi:PmbA protein